MNKFVKVILGMIIGSLAVYFTVKYNLVSVDAILPCALILVTVLIIVVNLVPIREVTDKNKKLILRYVGKSGRWVISSVAVTIFSVLTLVSLFNVFCVGTDYAMEVSNISKYTNAKMLNYFPAEYIEAMSCNAVKADAGYQVAAVLLGDQEQVYEYPTDETSRLTELNAMCKSVNDILKKFEEDLAACNGDEFLISIAHSDAITTIAALSFKDRSVLGMIQVLELVICYSLGMLNIVNLILYGNVMHFVRKDYNEIESVQSGTVSEDCSEDK